jgi:hypothetical protein
VKSEGEFFSQSKVLSRWLADQQDGWLASHRLMKAVRWDTVGQIPALDASGRTRLSPPKPDYARSLKDCIYSRAGRSWWSRRVRCSVKAATVSGSICSGTFGRG